uniref:Uncharacterized protein n=1 Tax=Setaria italica TaxID=4555 RepID=K3YW86_SETIT
MAANLSCAHPISLGEGKDGRRKRRHLAQFIPNPSPTWLLAVQKGAAARPLVDVREWRGEAEVVQRKGAAAVGDGNGTATAAATGDRKGVAAAAGVKRTCKAAASWMCLPLLDRSLIPPSTGAVLKVWIRLPGNSLLHRVLHQTYCFNFLMRCERGIHSCILESGF